MSGVLVAGLLAVTAVGCSSISSAPEDPPEIVPWSTIGAVSLGAAVDDVQRVYGAPLASQLLRRAAEHDRAGRAITKEWYRAEGGTIVVLYVGEFVRAIETANPRYRTPTGVFVGQVVHRGRCRRKKEGGCTYIWRSGGRSFRFHENEMAWISESKRLDVQVGMDRSLMRYDRATVEFVRFGDPVLMSILAASER
jgi:hypothetical protein